MTYTNLYICICKYMKSTDHCISTRSLHTSDTYVFKYMTYTNPASECHTTMYMHPVPPSLVRLNLHAQNGCVQMQRSVDVIYLQVLIYR